MDRDRLNLLWISNIDLSLVRTDRAGAGGGVPPPFEPLLLMNDGTSIFLLNDGTSGIQLNA